MILTLAVCYHARIQERGNFEEMICKRFETPIITEPISKEKFVQEISRYIYSYVALHTTLCEHNHMMKAFMMHTMQTSEICMFSTAQFKPSE